MPTVLNSEKLKALFDGKSKRLIYDEAVKAHNKLRVHADGEMPIKLIKNARPNESKEVMEYRQKIYESETQNPIERVLGVLEKIRRSADWMMRFEDKIPAIINKDETLEKYIKEKYPQYTSLENWLFEECLKTIALDANAVIAIMPLSFDNNAVDYVQPYAQIFGSSAVVDFVTDDFAVLKSEELSSLLTPDKQQSMLNTSKAPLSQFNPDNDETFTIGQVYYVINTIRYEKWETNGEKFQLTKIYNHGLKGLPVFQMPGKFQKRVGSNILKKTPLHSMVPHLNKAARESNDLDAGVIMHLYPEKWRINNLPCTECNGTAKKPTANGHKECEKCSGTGMANGKSPFNEIVIKPASLGEQNIPTPPIGYVVKDVEIIRLQNERIEKHIYKAYKAVNMEHLDEVQLNQSGTAKQYDRDEVNNLITTFAEAIVYCADKVVFWINELRYQIIQNPADRKKLLPMIPVPEKFDVLSSSFLITEYSTAKNAGLNPIILAELQKEVAQKKFYANPDVAMFIKMAMELDPFPDKTIDEKSMMASQGLATKEDTIMSNYIVVFIKRAMLEDPDFVAKPIAEKQAKLLEYAKEKTAELNEAKQLMADLFSVPGEEKKTEEDDDTGGVV